MNKIMPFTRGAGMIRYRRIIVSQLFIFSLSFGENIYNDLEEILSLKNNTVASEFKLLDGCYDHDDITVYKFLETQKSSYIVFIKDHNNNHYVVKQEKGTTLSKQFRALCETLCAHMACSLSIPSHHVRLLPI